MRISTCATLVALLLGTAADAAILCKKATGIVLVRERACKKKETLVDLSQFAGTDTLKALSCSSGQSVRWDGSAWVCATNGDADTLGGLACAGGQGVQWNGTAWVCAAAPLPPACGVGVPLTWNGTGWVCGTGLTVPGNVDLLSNGTSDGRIVQFPVGDPEPQTNASYDAANPLRLPIYWVSATGTGDLTAPCRSGDQLLSGGCVVGANDGCYVQRSYPILVAPSLQSGWHCREIDRTDGTGCANLTVLSLCLKSF
jgi:hypothetical protein